MRRFSSTFFVLLTLVAAAANAQSQVKFGGIVAGATLSDYKNFYGGHDTSDRWGATAGLVLGVRTARWMAITLEPAWTQMGGGDLRADYIDVPLTFGGVARSPDGKMRYGAYTGISGAFKLTCSEPSSISYCDQVKGSAWFIPIGLRFLRQAKPGTFVGLDVKYDIPLGSSFNNVSYDQRSWAFRLVFIKGNVPGSK